MAEILEENAKTMTVTYLKEDEIEKFREAAAPIYDKWHDTIGGELLKAFGYSK